MMKIMVHLRNNSSLWGGDMAVINSLCKGLRLVGVDVVTSQNIQDSLKFDLVILSNTCFDQRSNAQFLIERKIPYAVLPFHEDFIKYYQLSISFAITAASMLQDKSIDDQRITLDFWKKYPHIINFNSYKIPNTNIINSSVLAGAVCCMPSSNFEMATIKRDCPDARVNVIRFPTGLTENFSGEKKDDFKKLILSEDTYILQVGRLESRKNQIATVLATADIPKTLVFIATKAHNDNYAKLLFKLIKKYRKYRTIVVSQDCESMEDGNLEIIKMPRGEKLSFQLLESAYRNAEINLHPAFYELPGYTYLESVSCGTKTIMSDWSSANEYITLEDENGYLSVNPCSISAIRSAAIDAIYGNKIVPSNAKVTKIDAKEYGMNVLNILLKSLG